MNTFYLPSFGLLLLCLTSHLILADPTKPTYHGASDTAQLKINPISPGSIQLQLEEDPNTILNNNHLNPNNNHPNPNNNHPNLNNKHPNLNNKLSVELDLGFAHAFIASLSVIIVSELGDKTFFIAAILAMRHPRTTVFFGSLSALVLMTILSAFLGYATTLIPRWFTYYVSCALFALFGLKMLREAYVMDAGEAKEEYEEVQRELGKKDEETDKQQTDVEGGVIRVPQRRILYAFFSKIFLQSFMLTFLAEWGDRSQIATIILAARDEVVGVVLGGVMGHALCTFLAVVGGRFIAHHISIKTVHFIGGVVFLIFAMSAFFIKPEDH